MFAFTIQPSRLSATSTTTMESKKSSTRTYVLLFLAAAFIGGLVFAWRPLKAIYFSGVPKELASQFVCIPSNSNFEQVVSILKKGGFIQDENDFRWLAEKMAYKKDKMRAGRFEVQPGWTNRDLIQHLRNGEQAPVNVVLNNERLPEEVAGKVARFIEADSLALLYTFRDPAFLAEIGYQPETLMSIFIPNTYAMYWNTDAQGFVRKMVKEHDAFWAKNDRMKSSKIPLFRTAFQENLESA